MLFVLIMGVLTTPRLSRAAQSDHAEDKVFVPQGPLNFDACAQLAIKQSPYFTKTKIEMDIRKLDEADSRYSMIPPLTFYSYYYVDQPKQAGFTPNPFSLTFTTIPYNPVGAYFTLQAQKMATKMTILSHLKLISQGLEQLGKMFLELANTKRLSVLQDDVITLSRENLIYAQNGAKIGTATSLEVQVATQDLELVKNEKEHLQISQRRTMSSFKTYLGLKPEQPLELDLRDAPRQVLGNFAPATATLEQAKARSFDLKALELQQEMQRYNISLAKANAFPNIILNVQNPSPLNATSAKGIYVGVGLEIPVWDGFKRIRNISRQKKVLKEFATDKDMKEIDLTEKWTTLQEDIKSSETNLKITQSQEELVRLKKRQAEIRYQSGSEPLPTLLNARKASVDAQKTVANKLMEYNELILNLRQFSGDLGYSYVDEKSWQK
jgi:hypothetical protein